MSETTFSYDGAVIQSETITTTGTYVITAYGAEGGGGRGTTNGGLGAEISGDVVLTDGEVLDIIVGGAGRNSSAGGGGGGGGGFVMMVDGTTLVPLVVAGGGGGGGANNTAGLDAGRDASTTEDGVAGESTAFRAGGAGGVSGGGGGAGVAGGAGGGGFYLAGSTSTSGAGGGTAATAGGAGGSASESGAAGGFGGGGGGAVGAGGGGGYSGGGGGGYFPDGGGGGGGGSYDSGTSILATDALASGQNGNGLVTIELMCFLEGTLIATPSGERAVEMLRIGDLVLTAEGAVAPVRWMGHRSLHAFGPDGYLRADPLRVMPIRIRVGALGDNLPVRDLLVSPDHAILVEDILIQAGALVNGLSVVRERRLPERFTFYHVELADHALILAEGVAAETFVDNVNRLGFDNWAEHEALYGNEPCIAEMPYPRALSHRQVPQEIHQRLMDRVAMIPRARHAA